MPTCLFLHTLPDGVAASCEPRGDCGEGSYAQRLEAMFSAYVGASDFASVALRREGWLAADVVVNAPALQGAWARENGVDREGLAIVAEQVARLGPDVLYALDPDAMPAGLFERVRSGVRLVAVEYASPPSGAEPRLLCDVAFASHPAALEGLRQKGVLAHDVPAAFPGRVFDRVALKPWRERCHEVTVVDDGRAGGRSGGLEGRAWFERLADSKFAVHRGPSENSVASARRLVELASSGALVFTAFREGLDACFEVGREVVAYRSEDELVGLLQFYQRYPSDAEAVAAAGQARARREDADVRRMTEIARLLERHLGETEPRNRRIVPPSQPDSQVDHVRAARPPRAGDPR